MKIAKIVKGIFGKKVTIEAINMADLVEKLKWAEVEVQDTENALAGLQNKLNAGIDTMDAVSKEAEDVINHHIDILNKARARRAEFSGQETQVRNALKLVGSIYSEGEKN